MKWLTNFFNTSVGRKQLMALSGLMLSGFLVAHLSGNFLLLAGDGGELFNSYAEWLGSQPWLNAARAGLLVVFVVHVFLAFNLNHQNTKARSSQYYYKNPSDATLASRTMILTGVLVFVFVVIHLFNFTWGDKSGPDGLYGLVLSKFTHTGWSLMYICAMIVLGMHLVHGLQSVFQTFGIRHGKWTPIIKGLCILTAIGLALGFASIPVWLLISKGGM